MPHAQITHSTIGAARGLRGQHHQQALTAEMLTATLTGHDDYHNANHPLNPFHNPLEIG